MKINKNVLRRYILKNIKHYPVFIRCYYKRVYKFINALDGDSFPEKCYRYVFSDEIQQNNYGICPITGKKTAFVKFTVGYNKYFSKNEMLQDSKFTKLRRERAKETLIKKYGVDHQSKLDSVKEKIKIKRKNGAYKNNILNRKKTLLERYGDENYVNVDGCKKTKFEKYGNDTYNNREKMKDTFFKKYNSYVSPNTVKSTTERARRGTLGFKSEKFKNYLKTNGIVNVSQLDSVKNTKKLNARNRFLDSIYNGNRLKNKCIPLFKKEEYTDSMNHKKYMFKCTTCGKEFFDCLAGGNVPRCLECFPKSISKPQQEIQYFIKSILPTEDIKFNSRSVIYSKELDVYIPSKKFAIEYDGLYWHSENAGNKDRFYHINKTKKCMELGINLIHIFGSEWDNKQNTVKRKLCHLLKVPYIKSDSIINDGKEQINNEFFVESPAMSVINEMGLNDVIYARNCEIKKISYEESSQFCNTYHIQGNGHSAIRFGAYYNNELVAVMTFGKRRVAMGIKKSVDGEYEMIRFCVGEKRVVGIAGKLFKAFIELYTPKKVVSYADRRWSNENEAFYGKIGFKFIGLTAPSYFYFNWNDPNLILKHRFNFRKDQLGKKLQIFDPNLTEWENMQNNGYDRIWNCGALKYEWVNPAI
jgi:very-short-patch-repair endonuclease